MSLPLATLPAFRLPARIFHALPWLRHLYNHTVSAQDAALLHRQGTNMVAADWPGWRKGFYMPTPADGGVAALRRWLEGTEGGVVGYGPNVDAAPRREAAWNRETLFDNFAEHTARCRHCRKGLAQVRAGAVLAALAAAACVFALAKRLAAGAPLVAARTVLLGVGALAAAAVCAALLRAARGFFRTHWVHAENKKLLII